MLSFKKEKEVTVRVENLYLYNRGEAQKIIGFPGQSKDFTKWLRDNYFVSQEDNPAPSLIEREFMQVRTKSIKHDTEEVNVPLFTPAGIAYIKSLLTDKELLRTAAEQMRREFFYD